jgi:hypothetical protein
VTKLESDIQRHRDAITDLEGVRNYLETQYEFVENGAPESETEDDTNESSVLRPV